MVSGAADFTEDIDIIAQSLASLLSRLRGGSTPTEVNVTAQNALQENIRTQTLTLLSFGPTAIVAGGTLTITNSENARAILLWMDSDAATNITPRLGIGANRYDCELFALAANEFRAQWVRDKGALFVVQWSGDILLLSSAAATLRGQAWLVPA